MSAEPTRSSPSAPARMTRALARSTAPLSRPLAGRRFFPLWAVVRHTGRLTGREYAVPVAVRASPAYFVIALPWGDQTRWVRNVVAAGSCTIRWRGVDHIVAEPAVIGPDEALAAFNRPQRALLSAAAVRSFLRLRRADAVR